MKHILISFALLLTGCLYPQLLHGQNSISGKVTGPEGKPLPYVSVQLLRTDSTFMTGTSTDSLGGYEFTKITPSSYILVLSSVGYRTVKIPVTVKGKKELPLVQMKADNVMLSEVVVKGASVIRQKDKLLILPDKEQMKFAGTGYDLLYNLLIPGVEVDRIKGKLNVFGGEAALYRRQKSGLQGSAEFAPSRHRESGVHRYADKEVCQ